MDEDSFSASSAALERLRAAQDSSTVAGEHSTTDGPAAPEAPRSQRTPQQTTPPRPQHAPGTARPVASRDNAASADADTPPPLASRAKTRVNRWLDSLGSPDWDAVGDAIYEAPQRTRAAYQRAQARRAEERTRREEERRRREEEQAREQARLEAERAEQERLAAQEALEAEERREREQILAQQRAEEQALREELEREQAIEQMQRQQEREEAALRTAAREADGADYVPPASRRPLLQQPGEYLTDAQLLERAREQLPEWRRRDRIVEKAQAIEAATRRSAPVDAVEVEEEEPDYTFVLPYNLPSSDPDPAPTSADRGRQAAVTVAWLAFVLLSALGMGLLGGPSLDEVAAGRYASEVSMLSMSSWHQLIWPLLWICLGVHVAHQWLPSQAAAARQRRTGWRLVVTLALISVWFVLPRLGLAWFDLFVWLAVSYLLVDTIHQLNLHTARTRSERVITDGVLGLLAGWSLVFTATVISVWLARAGVNLLWVPAVVWALLALVVVIWGASMLSMTERGRITVALGLAWGMAAILLPRLLGPMHSVWVAILAAMGAFIVLLATENRRYTINHAEHRAALGHHPDDVY